MKKISVSLPDEDVAYLDSCAAARSASRSAVLHEVITRLRQSGLSFEYRAAAVREWESTDDAALCDATAPTDWTWTPSGERR